MVVKIKIAQSKHEAYGILGLGSTSSDADIKRAYYNLSLQWHPDKVPPGLSDEEKEVYKDNFLAIKRAYELLTDKNNNSPNYEAYICHRCRITSSPNWKVENGKSFCSQNCLDIFFGNDRLKEKCPECGKSYENKDNWVKWGHNPGNNVLVCSERCLADNLRKRSIKVFECNTCKKIRRYGEMDWQFKRKGAEKKYFCGDGCVREWINYQNKNKPKKTPSNDLKSKYLQQLTDLPGWKNDFLITQTEKQQFLARINNSLWEQPTEWNKVIQEAKDLIASRVKEENERNRKPNKKKDNEDSNKNNKNLPAEIQKAIQEIEAELNKEPKIEWKKTKYPSFEKNWKPYLESSSNFNELKNLKEELLSIIRKAREQQGGNITELRLHAIHLIKQALENNFISDSELTNPDWENDINQAQSKNEIDNIENQILAEIKNKKSAKEEKNRLNELLILVKQEENWNNYQNLENMLKQIKQLRSSNAYQEKESEIQAIENRLRELNPKSYKKTAADLLDQELKNNGLTESNMDEETKSALAEAKQNPTPENIAKAEEKIAQNGANNSLNNLITEIESKLKKGHLSEKEKVKLITDLLQFISKNNYQVTAYQKQKDKVDKLLARLRGEKSQDNTQNPPFWKKALVPLLIISLLGIMITIILILRRKRLKGKGR